MFTKILWWGEIMSYQAYETKIRKLKMELDTLEPLSETYQSLFETIKCLEQEAYENLGAYDQVYLSRHPKRLKAIDYIEALFEDVVVFHGDRLGNEDASIFCGVGMFNAQPVTIIAQMKGKTVEESIKYNFGMPRPSAYRKMLRILKQSEKFNRPVVTIIDTPGAYPGIEAEAQGQSHCISECLQVLSDIKVPVIGIVIGEGGSGGALALSVGDHLMMLEHSVYSILSPEGFASILYKDASKAPEVADLMKLQASDLLEMGFVDEVILEPKGGIESHIEYITLQIKQSLSKQLNCLQDLSVKQLLKKRYQRIRKRA